MDKIRIPKDIDKGKLRNYIAFMPKTEITYNARLELTLESELKQAVIAHAKQQGISTNELIRRAIRANINGQTSAERRPNHATC